MVKHGASHGFSVLVCTVIAAFIVEMLKPLVPDLVDTVTEASAPIVDKLHIPLAADFVSILIIATVLAVLWGMFFKRRLVK